tara:strand:- start:563 stop:1039 length:477 start_codon:yes stop_codon:yes gene_type:complete
MKLRQEFRTGNISIYPAIILKSNNPNAGKVKVVSARKFGNWVEIDHYGNPPFKTWNEVFKFMEDEIKILKEFNALSYISKNEIKRKYNEINQTAKIEGIDKFDFAFVNEEFKLDSKLIFKEIDKPNFEPGYYEPILLAWQNSLEKLRIMNKNKVLIDL